MATFFSLLLLFASVMHSYLTVSNIF